MPTKWSMEGSLLGACSCDWGCPCSFDAPPTRGFCEGVYVWHVDQGHFGNTPIDGLSFAWVGYSPGPLHLGNVATTYIVDEKANAEQRRALETLTDGGCGGPWAVFAAIRTQKYGPHYVPFEVQMDRLNSKARAGSLIDLELAPIFNPVTGKPEQLFLDKPTGFTSLRAELGATRVLRVSTELAYDHSGKYAEFSKFAYSGEAAA